MMKTYHGRIAIKNDPTGIIEAVRLTIENNNFEIEFLSSESSYQNLSVVNGIFNGLGQVTLINCRNVSFQSGAGAEIKKYRIGYLLIGAQIENPSEFYFDSGAIQMQGLLDWTRFYSVDYSRTENERILSIKELDKILIYESTSYIVQIYSANKISWRRNPDIRTISENAGFEIKQNGNQSLNLWSFLEIFKELQKIVLMFGNRNTEINSTTFYKDGIEPIKLLWQESISFGTPSSMGPVIEFDEIKTDLNAIISGWFKNEDIHTSIDLILEKSINTKLSRENYFLNNCFAIETFHRRFKNYKLFDKKEFKAIKEKILKSTDNPELTKLLDNNLAHINEPNFRNRLLDFTEDFKEILPTDWDPEEYLRKIVKTRNYLVHRSSSKHIFNKFDMLYAAFFLELITKISVFRVLGIKEDICLKALKQNGERIQGFYFSNNRMKF